MLSVKNAKTVNISFYNYVSVDTLLDNVEVPNISSEVDVIKMYKYWHTDDIKQDMSDFDDVDDTITDINDNNGIILNIII